MTVSQWADQYRYLSSESAAEHGKWTTHPFQRGPLDAISDPRVYRVVIKSATQLLKCLSVDTPILSATGWKYLQDVVPGDTLFDENGQPCKVQAASDIFHGRTCYRITFEDGESLIADAGHKWLAHRWGHRTTSGIFTTAEMHRNYAIKTSCERTRWRYRIQCAKPLVLPEANLPIDPYVFGAWLGDGNSYSAQITCDIRDGVYDLLLATGTEIGRPYHDARRHHVISVRIGPSSSIAGRTYCRRGHKLTEANRNAKGYCRKCQVLHSRAFQGRIEKPASVKKLGRLDTYGAKLKSLRVLRNKSIPDLYMYASLEQRRSLLQGILDTDGTARGSCVVLTLTREKLVQDVAALARTLGFKPALSSGTTTCNGKRFKTYSVVFTAYREDRPFRLLRKLNVLRWQSDPTARPTEARRRSIVSIQPVESVPVKCIAVDSPTSLYLVGHSLIPTHNTESILNSIGYFAHQDPGPILVLQPRDADAKAFSKERIAPMIRDTPALREVFSDLKSRHSDSTIEEKLFRGGMLAITSAGSPGNLARRAIRFLFADEVDKYPPSAGAEGNPISLARKRLATFRHRKKEILTCSPTVEGSEIDRAYAASDKREYFVPCPACGTMQSMMLKFRTNVIWDDKLPTREEQANSARYHCEACEDAWDDAKRWKAVEHGEWRAKGKFNGIAGFWISELYSPWKQLSEIVLDYLEKKDNAETLKTFINTSLAENWLEQGEAPEWEILLARREGYDVGTVPAGGLFLTCGVDVQRDRLEAEVVAWGRGRESWSVDYRIFDGKTSEPAVWKKLEEFRSTTFPMASGFEIPISRMFVDSGDGTTTNDVYNWVRMQPADRVVAIKGTDKGIIPVHQSQPIDVTVAGRKVRNAIKIKIVNVSFFKSELYADLKKRPPTDEERTQGWSYPPGFCHFPSGGNYGDEHFKQLCAEQLVNHVNRRTHRTKTEWQQMRERNEALDTRIYARAAAWDLHIDLMQEKHWATLEAQAGIKVTSKQKPIEASAEIPKPQEAARPQPARRDPWAQDQRRRGGGWLGDRGRSWLSR